MEIIIMQNIMVFDIDEHVKKLYLNDDYTEENNLQKNKYLINITYINDNTLWFR